MRNLRWHGPQRENVRIENEMTTWYIPDSLTPRTVSNRRARDLKFLDKLRAARGNLERLATMLRNHAEAPDWKRAAIAHRFQQAFSEGV